MESRQNICQKVFYLPNLNCRSCRGGNSSSTNSKSSGFGLPTKCCFSTHLIQFWLVIHKSNLFLTVLIKFVNLHNWYCSWILIYNLHIICTFFRGPCCCLVTSSQVLTLPPPSAISRTVQRQGQKGKVRTHAEPLSSAIGALCVHNVTPALLGSGKTLLWQCPEIPYPPTHLNIMICWSIYYITSTVSLLLGK